MKERLANKSNEKTKNNHIETIKNLVDERIATLPVQSKVQTQTQNKSPQKKKNMNAVNASPNVNTNSIQSIKYCINRNEDADAHLFVFKNSGRCRYDYDEGEWYIFNGTYWEKDLSNQVMKLFKDVIAWYEAAKQFIKSRKSDKLNDLLEDVINRIKNLSSLNRKRNVLTLAQGDLGVSSAKWDADPMLLGFKNGVVNLRTGEFRKGDPEDFIRTVCPVEWKGLNEPCPTRKRFLSEILFDNADSLNFIHRLLGSAISGKIREHVFIIFYGIGRNGKGTILEMMKWLLGGYGYKIKSHFLLSQKYIPQSGAADADTKSLKGKRFIYASETSVSGKLDISRIKELTGDDSLNARGLYEKDSNNFAPSHTLFLMTNNKPNVTNDYAFWERVYLVNFPLSYVNREPLTPNERRADLALREKLYNEASGIMAWLVRGCLDWQKQGLNPPASVIAATQEYKEEEDIIGNFIKDKCDLKDPNATEQASILYAAYCDWCEYNGYKAWSIKLFGKELKKRFESTRTSDGIIYHGIRAIKTLN